MTSWLASSWIHRKSWMHAKSHGSFYSNYGQLQWETEALELGIIIIAQILRWCSQKILSNALLRLEIKNSSYLEAPGDLNFFKRKKHGKAIYVTNLWLFLPRKLFFCLLMLLLYTLMWWGSFFCCCGLRLFDFTWGEELLVSEMSLNYKSRTKFELLKS